jgi:hypothetical protein
VAIYGDAADEAVTPVVPADLLAETKLTLRISSTAYDLEITGLIESAIGDLILSGVAEANFVQTEYDHSSSGRSSSTARPTSAWTTPTPTISLASRPTPASSCSLAMPSQSSDKTRRHGIDCDVATGQFAGERFG